MKLKQGEMVIKVKVTERNSLGYVQVLALTNFGRLLLRTQGSWEDITPEREEE